MDTSQYVRALRQWWPVIAAVTLIALLAGWFVKPGTKSYKATDTMILDLGFNNGDLSTASQRMAYLTKAGDVPKRVAQKLGGDPADLVKQVTTKVTTELGIIRITVSDPKPTRAVQLADTFGEELLSSVNDAADNARKSSLSQAQSQANALQQQISALEAQPQTETVQAQLSVLSQQYGQVFDQVRQLKGQAPTFGSSASGLHRVEKAQAVVANAPPSAKKRLAIGGFVGLLLGIGLALVLARLDTRIRTKEEVEEALSLPVLAEVPVLPRQQRKSHEIITVADPESLAAESYRALRTALLVAPKLNHPTPARSSGRGLSSRSNGGRTRTVMIVSADVGDGKTTTVANLAAACAESNKNVIVVDCDLRRPEIHRYLDVEMQPGVTDVLDSGPGDAARGLGDILQPSVIPKVQVVASGRPVGNPGEVLTRGTKVLDSARDSADVVLVDTAPILATDDASVLVARCDDVVVVCGAGRTTRTAARRTVERLTRLGASVAGVVLVRAEPHPTARAYYRAYVSKRGRRDKRAGRDDVAARAKEPQSSTPNGKGATDHREAQPDGSSAPDA